MASAAEGVQAIIDAVDRCPQEKEKNMADAELIDTSVPALIPDSAGALVIARPPDVILAEAQKAAAALQEVIAKKPDKVMMGGKQYLEFEDWQTLGRFYGVTAQEDGDPEYVELGPSRGFKASAIALHANGRTLSRATAYCMNDEDKWRGRSKYEYHYVTRDGRTVADDPGADQIVWEDNPAKPGKRRPKKERVHVGEEPVPMFQLASMAQTRACAKALRNVLSWVVVLAGYRPTPAEELTDQMRDAGTDTAVVSGAVGSRPGGDASPARITEAQQRRLWVRARAAGHNDGDVKMYLARRWGIAGSADIKRSDYEAIIARLDDKTSLGSLDEDVNHDNADETGSGEPAKQERQLPF